MTIETMSTRELQKSVRRRAILDAARQLILDGKDRDFSMPTLAAKAGVSLVTPYNLFGSKSSILLEIVREDIFERVIAVDAIASQSLTAWIADMSGVLARVYYRNRHFYRRMIVTLVAQENAGSQRASLEFSYRMFEMPLKQLQELGMLSTEMPSDILARHVAHSVSGSLQHRLMERGTVGLLKQEIEMGLLLLLAGICSDADRAHVRDRMAELSAIDRENRAGLSGSKNNI
jgi:AcrR family transcriptional regulator